MQGFPVPNVSDIPFANPIKQNAARYNVLNGENRSISLRYPKGLKRLPAANRLSSGCRQSSFRFEGEKELEIN